MFISLNGSSYAADMVISEIMFNPSGDENAREYVEVFNCSSDDISLEGFIIGDGEGFDQLVVGTGDGWLVPAGSYALILDPDYIESDERYNRDRE